MTVLTELCDVTLPWTGVETSFAPGFPARDPGHVRVEHITAAGARTPLTMGAHYTVNLAPGTLMIAVAPTGSMPAAPADLRIYRRTPATHANGFNDLNSYSQSIHEDLADRAAMRAAENRAIALDALAQVAQNLIDFTASQAAQDTAVAAQFGALADQIGQALTARDEAVGARNIAVTARDDIQKLYLGAKTGFPLVDNAGQPLQAGVCFTLTVAVGANDPGPYVWTGSGWASLGTAPESLPRGGKLLIDDAVAASGIVPVSGGYLPGYVNVWRNGVKQIVGASPGSGFGDPNCAASDGLTIVFPAGALQTNNVVEWEYRRSFTVAGIEAADVAALPAGGLAASNVQAALEELDGEVALRAPAASPTFTGTPVAPTPPPGNNSTRLATTAFVIAAIAAIPPAAAAPLPPCYLSGFTLANNGVDAANDIDIAIGSARDSTDALNILLAAALTKRLDANWAAGTNQGGLDAGTKANSTWYFVHAICKALGADVEALFSTSATAPTLPATYTRFRRIGAVLTDGAGAILAFKQFGDLFVWSTPKADLNTVAANTTHTAVTLTVPPIAGIEANIRGLIAHASLTPSVVVYRIGDVVDFNSPSGKVANAVGLGYSQSIPVNASGQVNYVSQQPSTTLTIGTISYIDRRGRDA